MLTPEISRPWPGFCGLVTFLPLWPLQPGCGGGGGGALTSALPRPSQRGAGLVIASGSGNWPGTGPGLLGLARSGWLEGMAGGCLPTWQGPQGQRVAG